MILKINFEPFCDLSKFLATQDLIVQPVGMVTLALNQMRNATFSCECTLGDELCGQPYWSLEDNGNFITTIDNNDIETLAQRGITYSSTHTTAVISIPDTVENNNTLIACAALLFGAIEFSAVVELIIIGESEQLTIMISIAIQLKFLISFRLPSTS